MEEPQNSVHAVPGIGMHSKFLKFQQNIMNNVNLDSTIEWMNKRQLYIQIFRYFEHYMVYRYSHCTASCDMQHMHCQSQCNALSSQQKHFVLAARQFLAHVTELLK